MSSILRAFLAAIAVSGIMATTAPSAFAKTVKTSGTRVTWSAPARTLEAGDAVRVKIRASRKRAHRKLPKVTVTLLRADRPKKWKKIWRKSKRSGVIKTPALKAGSHRLKVAIAPARRGRARSRARRAQSRFAVMTSPRQQAPAVVTPAITAAPPSLQPCAAGTLSGSLNALATLTVSQDTAVTFTNTSASCWAYPLAPARWRAADGTESPAQVGMIPMNAPTVAPGASFSVLNVRAPATPGEYDLQLAVSPPPVSTAALLTVKTHVTVRP